MKILDWYILKKFLTAYVFIVMVLLAVVTIINITERNEDLIKNQVGLVPAALYYLDYIPYIASMIWPITVFISVVFITSQMAQHTEIVAMLSSGISFRRIMRPYLYGAAIISLVSFYFGGWVIPDSNKDRVAFERAYFQRPYTFTDRDIHMKVGPESYMYLQSFNNHAKVGYRFTLETIDSNRVESRLTAQRLEWQPDSGIWKMKNWSLRKFDGKEEVYTAGTERDTLLRISPEDFDSDKDEFETLTMNELNDLIDELELRGADNIQVYEVEKYVRFASPFAAFILTFIGLTVAARKSRGGSGFQIALGFLLAFIYIIFYLLSRTSAQAGSIDPMIAVWIPNVIFTIVGLGLYKTLPR
jgi:lipopolysaccharide export system permease protein